MDVGAVSDFFEQGTGFGHFLAQRAIGHFIARKDGEQQNFCFGDFRPQSGNDGFDAIGGLLWIR